MNAFAFEVTAVAADERGLPGQATIRINKDSCITHIRFGGPAADWMEFDLDYDPRHSLPQDCYLGTCLMQTIGYAHGNMMPVIGIRTDTSLGSRNTRVVVHGSDPRVRIEEHHDHGYYTVHIGDQAALATLDDLLAAQQVLHYDRYRHERVEAQN